MFKMRESVQHASHVAPGVGFGDAAFNVSKQQINRVGRQTNKKQTNKTSIDPSC